MSTYGRCACEEIGSCIRPAASSAQRFGGDRGCSHQSSQSSLSSLASSGVRSAVGGRPRRRGRAERGRGLSECDRVAARAQENSVRSQGCSLVAALVPSAPDHPTARDRRAIRSSSALSVALPSLSLSLTLKQHDPLCSVSMSAAYPSQQRARSRGRPRRVPDPGRAHGQRSGPRRVP